MSKIVIKREELYKSKGSLKAPFFYTQLTEESNIERFNELVIKSLSEKIEGENDERTKN